jgi:hypothetical protein
MPRKGGSSRREPAPTFRKPRSNQRSRSPGRSRPDESGLQRLLSGKERSAHAGCHVKAVAAGVSRLQLSENQGRTNAQGHRVEAAPTSRGFNASFLEKVRSGSRRMPRKGGSSRREPAPTFRKPRSNQRSRSPGRSRPDESGLQRLLSGKVRSGSRRMPRKKSVAAGVSRL